MAYEVIKRVGGRAYRYRVESFRDPETRRVRGKWTYLGRVEGEGTLSPERQARPTSRIRLLNALEELLESRDISTLTTGIIATRAGLAYGTFYRYYKDVDHIVREAMLRHSAITDRSLDERFVDVQTAVIERQKIGNWVTEMIAEAQAHPGLIRAWHVASNQDAALVAERQTLFNASVSSFMQYIEKLNSAGLARVQSPVFNAYALVALCIAMVRDCAGGGDFSLDKKSGLIEVVVDLLGLPADQYATVLESVAS